MREKRLIQDPLPDVPDANFCFEGPEAPEKFSIQVARGCNDCCAYCGDKTTVGKLQSKPLPEIRKELARGLESGYRHIELLADDMGAYGSDLSDCTITDLLDMAHTFEQPFDLSLQELNIKYLVRYLPEIDRILEKGRIKRMVVAFQSGSTRVLKLMQRGYEKNDIIRILSVLNRHGVSTRFHALVGFPTETEAEFRETMNIVVNGGFRDGSIFMYQGRSYIPAAALMPQIEEREIQRRMNLAQAIAETGGYKCCMLPDKLTLSKKKPIQRSDAKSVWKNMAKETAPCGLCGSFSRKTIFQGDRYNMGLDTVVCLVCGFVFTDPRPTADEMAGFYREHFRTFYYNLPDPASPEYAQSSIGRASVRRAAWLGDFLLSSMAAIGNTWQPDSFLDIGCGDGAVLEIYRKLFPKAELSGIEPDAKYAAYAAQLASACVDTNTLEEFAAHNAGKRFAVVSMVHVLEHIANPRSVMKIISGLLSDQGLFLVQVPNFISTAWQRGSLQMFHLCHLTHYTPATLARLLMLSGFRIVNSWITEHPTLEPWSLTVLAAKTDVAANPLPAQNVDDIVAFIQNHILK